MLALPWPATEAVISLNVRNAHKAACGIAAQVSCSDDGLRWSDWFALFAWGEQADCTGVQESAQGAVDVDTLRVVRGARQWRYRLLWSDPGGTLLVRRVALCVTDSLAPDPARNEPNRKAWDSRLEVPYLSQWDARTFPPDRLCSPTAVAMVSRFYGLDVDAEQMATLAFDAASDLYGNWSFNVFAASLLGLRAYIGRGHSLRFLEDQIASGRPVIASIAFEAGALEHAPIPRSSGHLVVVCGFSDRGDVVVRDPAGRKDGSWMTYAREQFANAWIGHGGAVYLLARDES